QEQKHNNAKSNNVDGWCIPYASHCYRTFSNVWRSATKYRIAQVVTERCSGETNLGVKNFDEEGVTAASVHCDTQNEEALTKQGDKGRPRRNHDECWNCCNNGRDNAGNHHWSASEAIRYCAKVG